MATMAEEANKPHWSMPTAWPLFWRRLFFVTLPVSGPLWVAAATLCILFFMICVVVVAPIMWFLELKEKLWDR